MYVHVYTHVYICCVCMTDCLELMSVVLLCIYLCIQCKHLPKCLGIHVHCTSLNNLYMYMYICTSTSWTDDLSIYDVSTYLSV